MDIEFDLCYLFNMDTRYEKNTNEEKEQQKEQQKTEYNTFTSNKLSSTGLTYLEKQVVAHNLEVKRNHFSVIYFNFHKNAIKQMYRCLLKLMNTKEEYMFIHDDNFQ